jgi:hypothetical protein
MQKVDRYEVWGRPPAGKNGRRKPLELLGDYPRGRWQWAVKAMARFAARKYQDLVVREFAVTHEFYG